MATTFAGCRVRIRTRTAVGFVITLLGLNPPQASAAMVTIEFDLVKVSAKKDNNGDTILSAMAIGDGPFKDLHGAGSKDFLKLKADGTREQLNGFTSGGIVANHFEDRYFGSVAAPSGSILQNLSHVMVNPDLTSKEVPGTGITGFELKLAQPDQDDIAVAKGGNAFPSVSIAADKNSVTFSNGGIPNMPFPSDGGSGLFLWSLITPEGPQPKFPQVLFTKADIPPDPAGDFKDV